MNIENLTAAERIDVIESFLTYVPCQDKIQIYERVNLLIKDQLWRVQQYAMNLEDENENLSTFESLLQNLTKEISILMIRYQNSGGIQ